MLIHIQHFYGPGVRQSLLGHCWHSMHKNIVYISENKKVVHIAIQVGLHGVLRIASVIQHTVIQSIIHGLYWLLNTPASVAPSVKQKKNSLIPAWQWFPTQFKMPNQPVNRFAFVFLYSVVRTSSPASVATWLTWLPTGCLLPALSDSHKPTSFSLFKQEYLPSYLPNPRHSFYIP